MSSTSVQVSQGGRIVIPAEIRQKMGINIGDQVLLSWLDEAHELRISTRAQRLQHARNLASRYATNAVVDSFISERQQAAANE